MEGRNLKQMLLILLFQFAFNSAFVANVRTFFYLNQHCLPMQQLLIYQLILHFLSY